MIGNCITSGCNGTFEINPRARRRRNYCDDCNVERNRIKNRRAYTPDSPKYITRICALDECSVSFETSTLSKIYCCRKHADKARRRRFRTYHKRTIEDPLTRFRRGAKPLTRFMSYAKGAERRGLDFDITYKYFKDITSRPCFYCGRLPNGEFNGIDRINNEVGYTEDNCVPCCKTHNYMRGGILNLSVNDFINECINVTEQHNKKYKALVEYDAGFALVQQMRYIKGLLR